MTLEPWYHIIIVYLFFICNNTKWWLNYGNFYVSLKTVSNETVFSLEECRIEKAAMQRNNL